MATTGKYLTSAINGVDVAGTHEWSVEEVGDRLDRTVGADQGRGNPEVGVIDTKITIKFYFDITAGVINFIRTGVVLADLSLFADGNSGTALYTIDLAIVLRIMTQGRIRDQWVVTAEIEAQGDVVAAFDGA